MQKLSDEQILTAKEEIMKGQSISSVAKNIGMDRKTLKLKIINLISEEERESFENKLSKNLRKNKVSIKRQKKIDAEENYKKTVNELVEKGIKKEDIEIIYEILSSNSHSKMSKDTFVIKLLDLLYFSEERNKGIDEESKGYISKDNLIEMIRKDKKFMTSDINKKIKPVCQLMDDNSDLTKPEVNEIIKQNPHIFRNSTKKINMLSIIGENFLVRKGIEYIGLFKYILQDDFFMLAMNPEKLFKRLSEIVNTKKSTIITREDLDNISRNEYKNTHVEIDDSKINEKYKFPEYDEKEPEKFRTEIRRILSFNKEKNVKEQ